MMDMPRNLFYVFIYLAITLSLPAQAWADRFEIAMDAISARIETDYGLTFVYKDIPDPGITDLDFKIVSPSEYPKLYAYIKLVEEEIRKYPKEFFEKRELKRVLFVKKLFFQEKPTEGLFNYSRQVIFFDYARSYGQAISQRHNIHHEFYHMIEVGHEGWKDPAWEEFNASDFFYGKNLTESTNDRTVGLFAPAQPGFVTDYATTSAEEDKAEVYACLFIESQRKILSRWIKTDLILQHKVTYMKDYIREYCDKMDDNYWRQLFP